MMQEKYPLMTSVGTTLVNKKLNFQENIELLQQQELWQEMLGYTLATHPIQLALRATLFLFKQRLQLQDQHDFYSDVRDWLNSPSETLRWTILNKAKQAGYTEPFGLLGLALFTASGSLSPEGCEPINADPHLAPFILLGAVKLALEQSSSSQPMFDVVFFIQQLSLSS